MPSSRLRSLGSRLSFPSDEEQLEEDLRISNVAATLGRRQTVRDPLSVSRPSQCYSSTVQRDSSVVVPDPVLGSIHYPDHERRVRLPLHPDLDLVCGACQCGHLRHPFCLVVCHLELPARDWIIQRADVRLHGAYQSRPRPSAPLWAIGLWLHRR